MSRACVARGTRDEWLFAARFLPCRRIRAVSRDGWSPIFPSVFGPVLPCAFGHFPPGVFG
jgi:hypothetical protein